MTCHPVPLRRPSLLLRLAVASACAGCLPLLSLAAQADPGGTAPGASAAGAKQAKADTRRAFYVRFGKGRQAAVEQSARNEGGEITHRFPDIDAIAVMLPEAAASRLAAMDHVALVEPVPEHALAAQVVPWNIDQFQARDIWDADRDGIVDSGAPTGAGVKVCIIDTGFYAAHDDFQGITVSGVSQITGQAWTEDGNGHGTHVAGTVNAMHNTLGVVGVLPGGAELFIVKIFNNDGVWQAGQSNLGAAANLCRDAGANVISMSLGGGYSSTEESIFQTLYDTHGIVNVAAAGNDGNSTASYPASYDSVISVAAIDESAVAADFTQYPATAYNPASPPANVEWDVVELAGGGVNVLSTWPGSPYYADGEVPVYQAIANGITYQGNHIDEAGVGTVSGPLVDGGLCTTGSGNAGWAGAVVLCDRGSVAFSEKVNEAGSRGALAAIIANNVAGNFTGTCAGACTTGIPAISVSQADGVALRGDALGDATQVLADDGTGCSGCSGSYNTISGTSMATPGVAAGLGFVWDACGGPAGITNKQLRQLLRDSALDLQGTQPVTGQVYGAGWDRVTGWGLIQLMDAMELGNQRFGSTCPIGLAVSPSQAVVCGLTDDTADFSVTLDEQFTGSATLSASGLPTGGAGSFSPNPVVHPVKLSNYAISGLSAVASGSYPLQFTAVDGADPGNSNEGLAMLTVHADVPGTANPTMPGNGSTNVALSPTLAWNGAADASSYLVEVATDAGFANIVYSASATGTSHTVTAPLANDTVHYWRVTPANLCGSAASSTVYSFTTTQLICIAPGAAIPDNNTAGVNSDLAVTITGTLTDLNVDALIDHTWVGDLIVTLTHVATGTTIDLIDRPGRTNSGAGCNGDDIDTTLDDEAASPVESECAASAPTIAGSFTPNAALSAFDGEDIGGTWRLNVRDRANADTGTLVGWCLQPTLLPGNADAVANDDSATVDEDSSNNAIDVLANDSDAEGDAFAVTGVGAASNGSTAFTAAGVSYTPDADYCGADSFTYTITGGASATVTVDVTCVDDAAVANADSATVAEDSASNAIDVLANDTDAEDDAIAVTAVGTAANGSTAFTAGGVSYTPGADYCGADAFDYTITGGATATVTIDVTCVDDAAVANADSATVAEDSANNAIDVLANDTDAEGDAIAVTVVGTASNGSTAFTAAGVSYTPDADYCGADSFTYTITGGASATVAVTVTCVDDAAVANADSATVAEDSASNAIDVLANDTDAEGDAIAVTAVGAAANGSTGFTAGGVSYTPSADYCGADSFTYTITGGASATVAVTVTCVDDAAVANADSATVDEDSSNNAINVLANDSDPDSALVVTGVGAAANGSTAFTAGGVSYTPDADYCGADGFTYTIAGGASATVSVAVDCVNDAPVAVGNLPDRIATEGEAVAYATSAAFADVDAGDTLGFSASGLPASLSIDPSSGQISGTLAPGDANGSPYAVVVTATDGDGASVQQAFALSVLAGGPVGGDIFKDGFE